MNLLTKQDLVRLAPERFRRQYSVHFGRPATLQFLRGRTADEAFALLQAATTVEDVVCVLNESWTRLQCDGCRRDVDVVVEIPGRAQDEYGPCHYCRECIGEAAEVLRAHDGGKTE
jgi:hypothetical protein